MQQRIMKDLRGDDIAARDGRIGRVKDAYFDDEKWAVRYLVVDTGEWLPGRRVLISPASVRALRDMAVEVDLSRDQVEHAPDIDEAMPVSRLYEEAHAQYYGYPLYWSGGGLWGYAAAPMTMGAAEEVARAAEEMEHRRDALEAEAGRTHLRSSAEVVGYSIEAADGPIGHVEDFVIDGERWTIDDMVVDTRNWLPGRKVLVPPSAIEDIDWNERRVHVRLTREELKHAPEAH